MLASLVNVGQMIEEDEDVLGGVKGRVVVNMMRGKGASSNITQ